MPEMQPFFAGQIDIVRMPCYSEQVKWVVSALAGAIVNERRGIILDTVAAEAIGQMAGALIVLGLFLLAGKAIRRNVGVLQALFLPTSVVAGVLGLLLGPQVLGALLGRILGESHFLSAGLAPGWALDAWSQLPKLLISVVFASLLMGKALPSIGEIWRKSGPQVLLGYTLAFGQYALGFLVVLLVLTPFFGLDEKAGALLEIAFTGGHGTAAGLVATFEQTGFEEGRDLALGLATVGVVMGVVLGTLFINIGVRSKRILVAREETTEAAENFDINQIHRNEQPAFLQQDDAAADPLSLHFALIGVAIAIGWLLKEGLVLFERFTWGRLMETPLMPLVPLFPLAMIGGVILQLLLTKLRIDGIINRELINRISGAALDIIIVAAMATISLEVLGSNWVAFLLLSLTAVGWSVFVFWVLTPRMIPDRWFERGLGDMGQSTGMAVTGLLLLRISDPRNRTGAIESFGYKQLLFEPLVGGGLITALSIPLTVQFGPWAMLTVTLSLTLACLFGGMMLARRLRN